MFRNLVFQVLGITLQASQNLVISIFGIAFGTYAGTKYETHVGTKYVTLTDCCLYQEYIYIYVYHFVNLLTQATKVTSGWSGSSRWNDAIFKQEVGGGGQGIPKIRHISTHVNSIGFHWLSHACSCHNMFVSTAKETSHLVLTASLTHLDDSEPAELAPVQISDLKCKMETNKYCSPWTFAVLTTLAEQVQCEKKYCKKTSWSKRVQIEGYEYSI